jgi:hypothetical protein
MSLYMRWPLRNFYTFNHLVDSYRNTISEWAVGFRYRNFTLKSALGPKARGRQGFSSRGLIFGGEEISIPETRPIRKSYIYLVQNLKLSRVVIDIFILFIKYSRCIMTTIAESYPANVLFGKSRSFF